MSPDGVINYSSETMQMESGTFHPNILIGNCTGKGLEEVEDPQFDPNDDIASCKIKYSLYKISENVKLAQMKLTVEELAQKLGEPDISTPCMCSTWRWLWPWRCPRPCLWHGHAGG